MDARASNPKPDTASAQIRKLPHNIEAEQALLGAILINNEALDVIGDKIQPHQFYDPLHARIFEAIQIFASAGKRADPLTLKAHFALETIAGRTTVAAYFGRLVAAATSIINAKDYAKTVYDLWVRRELIALAEDMSRDSYESAIDVAPADQIEEAEGRLFALGDLGGQRSHESSIAEAMASAMDAIAAAYETDGGLAGLSTGHKDLDAGIGGLAPENLIIIGGRPSMGKSALAAGIAFNVAKTLQRQWDSDSSGGRGANADSAAEGARKRGEVVFYSLEMSREQLSQRQLGIETGIPADRQRRGEIDRAGGSDSEFRRLQAAADELSKLPLHIDHTGSLTIAKLISRARRRKRLHDTRLIVIDYLQLMASGRNRDNRASEVAEISMALKGLAKELGIPIIALSQLSRALESRVDKRPQLSDLRESGAIEQDADIVMFVYREQYYLERAEPTEHKVEEHREWEEAMVLAKGMADIIIAKHRHGSVCTKRLQFTGELTRFSDHEDRRQESIPY